MGDIQDQNNLVELRNILERELRKLGNNPNALIKLKVNDETLRKLLLTGKDKLSFALNLDLIKKIDLSNLDFAGFDASGFDFSDFAGVKINPQTIAEKDLHNTKLKGVTFTGSFDDVDIRWANFTGSMGAVIDPQTIAGKDLSEAKLNGVTFNGSFDGVRIDNTDFTGSTGAIIDPQTIARKDLFGCKLNGVNIVGTFNDVKISYTNFTGCKNIVIDPQIIAEKSLCGAVLNGVTFTGSFDDVSIRMADFTGSTGAIIDPDKIWDLDGTDLGDTILTNEAKSGTSKAKYKGIPFDTADENGLVVYTKDVEDRRKEYSNTLQGIKSSFKKK